jgi:hypothetical protein
MKSISTRTLQILTGVGAVLYFAGTAMSIFVDDVSFLNPKGYVNLLLLLVFIAGFVLSWTNKKMAGIIFMIWNAGIWIFDLYLFREADYSMISAAGSSFMVIGAFFLLEWYKTSKATVPSKPQQWKFILRVLLINYAVLYFIVVLSELFAGEGVNFFNFPFIIYPMMLLIFLVGFLLSWKREFLAGFIFLFWFAISLSATLAYSEISRLGPWVIFGLPILLQGIFYIKKRSDIKAVNKR